MATTPTPTAPPAGYDTTLALIAGTIAAQLAGQTHAVLNNEPGRQQAIVTFSVAMARAIVTEIAPAEAMPTPKTV